MAELGRRGWLKISFFGVRVRFPQGPPNSYMAKFEEHCNDCEKILGNRHEDVNRWIDELFRQYGPEHRRHRHCWTGVREAEEKFGLEGAKAAIVHIVRDCGRVPLQREYNKALWGGNGIFLAPEFLMYDGANEKAFDKFKRIVEEELKLL